MSNKSNEELSEIASMNLDNALIIILKFKKQTLPKNKALMLSQIIPSEIWQTLNQGQKGYVGMVFYSVCEDLGFEYVGKGKSRTTNLYLLVTDID